MNALQLLAEVRRRFPTATKVTVSYTGSGDEGWMDEVCIWAGEEELDEIEQSPQGWAMPEGKTDDPLTEPLRDFAEEVLLKHCSGYENNEGGFGTVAIDLMRNTTSIEHYDYVQESVADENNYEEPILEETP